MKKIARALGILLLVAFSFSCSNLFDEKKYNSSTLEKDSRKDGGDSGGSGGNGGSGGSGGSGGNGGSGGDTYVKPETYLTGITDTRFYEVYTAEAKLDSYTVGERLQLTANLMTDKGLNVQSQLDAKVTKVNYVTIEPRNYTIPLNILFATNDTKEIPLYSATLHNIAEGTTVQLGTQFIIIGVSEYGVLAINCRDGIVSNATEFMTFFCTKKGIEHYFAGKKNGWYTFYIEDVNFKYKYPTEEEIKLEVKKITQPDGGDNGSSASDLSKALTAQTKAINDALNTLEAKTATAFKPSLTAPEEGTETITINESLNQVYWKDGTVIYYYSPDGSKISLGDSTSNMFDGCQLMQEIDLSGFDSSNVSSMSAMFQDCKVLETVNLSSLNTSKVISFDNMFNSCQKLKSLELSNFDTSKARVMNKMFCNCVMLEELDLSNFDTINLLQFDEMFSYCESLKKIVFSEKFDTSKVTRMYKLFSCCYALESIDLSSFNTQKVYTMQYMFNRCKSLTEIDISNFDVSNVNDLGGMFYICENLKTIYCAKDADWSGSVKTNCESKNMFYKCTSLMGGQGTGYTIKVTDILYARTDHRNKLPQLNGYFTEKK